VDTAEGVFALDGLKLGAYTVNESLPPAGYFGDARVETANLSIASPSASLGSWVNYAHNAQLTPTGTDCTDFINGTAQNLDSVIIGSNGATTPGAFIFFARLDTNGQAFSIPVVQTVDPEAPLFDVLEAKLWTASCQNVSNDSLVTIQITSDLKTVIYTVTGTLAETNTEFITYVKYKALRSGAVPETTYTFTAYTPDGFLNQHTLVAIRLHSPPLISGVNYRRKPSCQFPGLCQVG
jgi:hypothetical protein